MGTAASPSRFEVGTIERGILRQRLIDAINLPDVAPVTLITAPAGFGKSTLATQWVHETDRVAIWVSLHSESNTPDRFLNDLQRALEMDTGSSFENGEANEPSLSAILIRLRDLGDSWPATIVFDDYHLIENQDVHRVMNALIHELPADISMMILSRTLPPLALGRARVDGQVREVTEVDLRFDLRDAAALVRTESNRKLTSAQIDRLTERTEGWIAGIRLALLAMLQVEEEHLDQTIDAFSTHQWLDDYIVEEVLDTLPAGLRNFVLRTAGLGVLDPKLCDAVLGIDSSAALIDELVRRLVFVRRDTRRGIGVSFHSLFAECVERIAERMHSVREVHAQHLRAAIWLEQHGRYEEALDHALVCEDWSLALRIARAICEPLWQRDLHHSLLHWMEKLPLEQLRSDHELLYWYIHKLFSTGRFRDAMLEFERAESLWQASGAPKELGFVMSCRAFKAACDADTDTLLAFSYRALHYYTDFDHVTRMRTWFTVSDGEFMRGNDEIATAAYQQSAYHRRFLPVEQRWWTLLIELTRINQYATRGNLLAAERLYQVAREQLRPEFGDGAGRYHVRLASIYQEWNELDRAQREVEHFITAPERFPWQNWYVEAQLTAVQVAVASGRLATADQTLKQLFTMMNERGQTHTTTRAQAIQAQLWLMQGEILLASAWGDSVRINECGWTLSYGETDPYLVLIQLRMAQNDLDEVLSLATTRIAEGVHLKRHAELVPLYVWQAAALRLLGRHEEARESVCAALKLGMPGRFNRSFFPFGADLTSLYLEVKSTLTPTETAYLDRLLEERGLPRVSIEPVPDVPREATSPGLLSPREREILELIRDGLPSREIADRLFIGESTIKKHLTRAFFKLKVENRTAAVMRAQEIGLLR